MDCSQFIIFTQWTLLPDSGQHDRMVDSQASVLCATTVDCTGNILFWKGGKKVKTTKGKDRLRRSNKDRRIGMKIY